MADRKKADGKHRKAVPLDDAQLAAVEAARIPGSSLNGALRAAAGAAAARSEASTLSALVQLGLQALNERALERAYEEMAAARDEEDVEYERALRARGARRSSTRD